METEYLAQAELTIQVTEDEWRRKRVSLKVKPETTIQEIADFFKKQNIDFRTGINIHELNSI